MLQINFTDFLQNFDNLQQDKNWFLAECIMINISSSFQISVSFSHFDYQVFFTALIQVINSFQNLTLKSEKLSDISEYEEKKNKLVYFVDVFVLAHAVPVWAVVRNCPALFRVWALASTQAYQPDSGKR